MTELIGSRSSARSWPGPRCRGTGVQRDIHERLNLVLTFLLPVFFVVVGLATRIDMLDSPYLWGVTLLVIATAIAGKWATMLAARVMGETWRTQRRSAF